jgi:hypothetical protein
MEKKYDIKEMVRKGKVVRYVRYRKGELIYVTECGFEFPIPVYTFNKNETTGEITFSTEEIGDGVFNAEENAMMLMRYIRKHIAAIEQESEKANL